MTTTDTQLDRLLLTQRVHDYLCDEADLLDAHAYKEWEALWDDDAEYWVPVGSDDYDPTLKVSIVYDDRNLIAARVRKIIDGGAYAEDPPTAVTRAISNLRIDDVEDDDGRQLVHASARFVLVATRRSRQTVLAGRLRYRLRVSPSQIRLVGKTVLLSNSVDPLFDIVYLL